MVKLSSEMKRGALCPPLTQHMLDTFQILMSLHTLTVLIWFLFYGSDIFKDCSGASVTESAMLYCTFFRRVDDES